MQIKFVPLWKNKDSAKQSQCCSNNNNYVWDKYFEIVKE